MTATYSGSLAISDILHAYAAGTATPESVVEACYDRFSPDNVGAYSSVFVRIRPKHHAIQDAEEIKAQYAHTDDKPPLYCIPFTAKTNMDVWGCPTTAGCPAFEYKATRTAPCVQRLRDAGAILIGFTNMDQFASGLTGMRSPYGTVRCAIDADYIAGGSSSGAAVSVARDFASFAIGTDTAGSIRIPAGFNGLVGLKPTCGRISTVGIVPACQTVDSVGVLAKTVDCARRVFAVLEGFDERDPFARHALPARPQLDAPSLRVGFPLAGLDALSDQYKVLWERALDRIRNRAWQGCRTVNEFNWQVFDEASAMLYGSSIVAQRLVPLKRFLDKHGTSAMHPATRVVFEGILSKAYTATDAYSDMHALAALKRQAEVIFRDHIDILVVPTAPRHYRISEIEKDPVGLNGGIGMFASFVNPLDLAAIAVPAGTWTNANGIEMPFSITLVGQAGRDQDLMRLAEMFVDAA